MSLDQERRIAALQRRSRRRDRTAAGEADDLDAQSTGGGRRIAATPAPPRLPGRRNPKWIALGVLAICLGGLLSYVVYAQVARQDTVLVMAATVYRGEVIEQADLTTVTLGGGTGLATVPSARLPELVGQRAAYDLVSGSVLTPDSVGASAVPALKRSIVGVLLDQGRAPARYLFPGSTVRLVVVPLASAQPGATDPYKDKNYPAVVVDTEPGTDGTSLLVNVDVGTEQAALIAMLSASGRLAIVRDADR